MTLPSISIVVLSYNYERYLGAALASAVGQEPGAYRLAEVVVVDDGSTDGSAALIAGFPGVRLIRTPHEGFGPTLTRAVGAAAGDWVAPLDADDTFAPDKLRVLAPHLRDPGLLFVQHGEHVIDADGNMFAEGRHPGGSTSTLMIRTRAARELLPVTNELFFHVLADLGHGIRLDEPLTSYRVHDGSMTDRRTPGVFADYMAGICLGVARRLDQLGDSPPRWATAEQLAQLSKDYLAQAADRHDEADHQRQHA